MRLTDIGQHGYIFCIGVKGIKRQNLQHSILPIKPNKLIIAIYFINIQSNELLLIKVCVRNEWKWESDRKTKQTG